MSKKEKESENKISELSNEVNENKEYIEELKTKIQLYENNLLSRAQQPMFQNLNSTIENTDIIEEDEEEQINNCEDNPVLNIETIKYKYDMEKQIKIKKIEIELEIEKEKYKKK